MSNEVKETETSNGIDKGFVLLYSKLSPRRKFIRTIWTFVIGLVLVFLIIPNDYYAFGFLSQSVLLILGVIIGIIQATSNYKKWKKGEKSN